MTGLPVSIQTFMELILRQTWELKLYDYYYKFIIHMYAWQKKKTTMADILNSFAINQSHFTNTTT